MTADRHLRGSLPIPDRRAPGLTTYDAKDPDTSFPPIEPLLPPAGAPNVVVVLLDDVGFAASSVFGGPCRTPTAERLAAGGLRYNSFPHTAPGAAARGASGGGRIGLQPLPPHRAVRAAPPGAPHRPQPPLGRHGQHHRDGD